MRVCPAGNLSIWPVVIATEPEDKWLLAHNAEPTSASVAGPGQEIDIAHRWDLSALLAHWPPHATHACIIQDDIPIDDNTLRYMASQVARCKKVDLYAPAIRRSIYSPSVALSFSTRVVRVGFVDLSCAVLSRAMVERYGQLSIPPGEYGWHLPPMLGLGAEYVWCDRSVELYHTQERPEKLSGLVSSTTYMCARKEAEGFMGEALESKLTFGYNHRIWAPSAARRSKEWKDLSDGMAFNMAS